MINKDAINDFNSAFHHGPTCFYIITASHTVQKQVAASFVTENVAVYDYSGKEDKFFAKDIFDFIEENNEKEVFFFLNFQIPFLGKAPDPEQPDYFTLNFNRDAFSAYHKKLFFFMTKEIEYNISLAAMDFFDYCFPKIVFEDEKKDEIEQQMEVLYEDYDQVTTQKAEIEYRLNLYKDKVAEYLNIDISKYATIFIENAKTLTPEEEKTKNYLLVAARDLEYFARLNKNIYCLDKSLELYNKALDIRKKIQGAEHFHITTIYDGIAFVYWSQGDFFRALEYSQKALRIREKVFGDKHPEIAGTYNNMGSVYALQGDLSKALEYFIKALEIQEEMLGNEHPDVAKSYNNIGAVYASQNDYSKALEYYQKALKIREKVLGNEHPDTARSYLNIGRLSDLQGDYLNALEYYQKTLKIEKKMFGNNHPNTLDTSERVKKINEKLSKL